MKLIDCSASIGWGGINREIVNHENYFVYEKVDEPADAAELLAEMDFCGIDKAAVYQQAAMDVSPAYGNARLQAEVKGQDRLYTIAAWLPPLTDEEFGLSALEKELRTGIAGIRLSPQINRFMLDRITCGDLLDFATERKLPVYLSPAYGWEYIFAALKEFPALTVILTNYGLWGSDRYFWPLLHAYKRVYVDMSDMQELRGPESFVNRFGSERLLFGTNYPMDNMGGPVATLIGANLAEEDRENVAHANFERLYAEVRR